MIDETVVWVDADACPVMIKEIIFRAANRTKITATLVANNFIKVPPSPYIHFLQVPQGFDVADNEIAARIKTGQLLVTADIPLAAEVMEKGAIAINPRGGRYSEDTIGQRLNMRDFMDTMRSSGVHSGGPPPMGAADKQIFAGELDKFLHAFARNAAATANKD
ncbi:MAG: hypothetical protein ACI8Z1_001970 [Candidatus Azotimanducaceae bacterium]|jgi:uncharacterized protein YaiI (UPF0178 family)